MPFVDGFLAGAGHRNFFDRVSYLGDGEGYALVSRSDAMSIPNGGAVGAYSLFIRYSQSNGPGVVDIGLMSADTGQTLKGVPHVVFHTIDDKDIYADWHTVQIDFTTSASWPSAVYARLHHASGPPTFVDSAWISPQ